MTSVFLLQHTHVHSDGTEDYKTIGIYSSKQAAEEAVKRAVKRTGFDKSPDGFNIDEYPLDKDNWVEGYFTYTG